MEDIMTEIGSIYNDDGKRVARYVPKGPKMNLTWTENTDIHGQTYWACEIRKYRFVVTEVTRGNKFAEYYGRLIHDLESGPYVLESGEYKSERSAKAGLKRRAAKYGI
jgi:hypothetical protein